jgi:folate-dependent tRNA-U54 methylase TrmFO/GidA
MNANFGLMEPLPNPPKDKFKKKEALAERAMKAMGAFADQLGVEIHA